MSYLKLPSTRDTGTLAALELNQETAAHPNMNLPVCQTGFVLQLETLLTSPNAIPDITLLATLDKLRSHNPDILIGRYLSAWVLDDPTSPDGFFNADPPRRLPGPGLPGCIFDLWEMSRWKTGPNKGKFVRPWMVDLEQPNAMRKLLNALLAAFETSRNDYGARIAKTDNWGTAGADFPFSLATALAYYDLLNQGIQQLGLLHAANFSQCVTSPMADGDILRIAKADMVYYEGATTPAQLGTPDALAEWLRRTALVQSAGCTPLLIEFSEFGCGLAMVLDDARLGYAMGSATGYDWPKKLGAPTRPMQVDGTTIVRRFEKGGLTVDCAKRTAAVT